MKYRVRASGNFQRYEVVHSADDNVFVVATCRDQDTANSIATALNHMEITHEAAKRHHPYGGEPSHYYGS
jgi:hypothetical protein